MSDRSEILFLNLAIDFGLLSKCCFGQILKKIGADSTTPDEGGDMPKII